MHCKKKNQSNLEIKKLKTLNKEFEDKIIVLENNIEIEKVFFNIF